MAAHWAARVASKAAASNGRMTWLMANARSVRLRSRAHRGCRSGTGRTAVPTLPTRPAQQIAAASSTESERRYRQRHRELVAGDGSHLGGVGRAAQVPQQASTSNSLASRVAMSA
jgi:hypothetical protein